ncbi:MAG: hypothetical protein ACR2F2_03080 [Pyrinomonadaceae bacterium]
MALISTEQNVSVEILKTNEEKNMKNTFLKTIGTAAMTILLTVIFANISVSAQDVLNTPQTGDELTQLTGNQRGLEGTWDVLVTIRNCQNGAAIRTFPSIGTFMFGGTMLDSTSGTPQAAKTPGHGVWQHLTGRKYRFKFKSFTFDANGNSTGWTIITHEADLNRRASAYESAGFLQIYNMNGDLTFTGCATTTAVRFE